MPPWQSAVVYTVYPAVGAEGMVQVYTPVGCPDTRCPLVSVHVFVDVSRSIEFGPKLLHCPAFWTLTGFE
jgi:hypothetical protein